MTASGFDKKVIFFFKKPPKWGSSEVYDTRC